MKTEKELVSDLQKSISSQSETSSPENIEMLEELPMNSHQWNQENFQWSLQEFSEEELKSGLSEMQKYILGQLEKNNLWMDSIINLIAEKAKFATAVNPVTGEQQQSDTVQLQWMKELLNILKLRQASGINIIWKINLNKIIYGLK